MSNFNRLNPPVNINGTRGVPSTRPPPPVDDGAPKMTKRTCARCKESNKCIKLLYSRIGRIEDLVNSLAVSTKTKADVKDPQSTSASGIPQILVSQPQGESNLPHYDAGRNDFSDFSLDDIQHFIIAFTNSIVSANVQRDSNPSINDRYFSAQN
ncbi:12264_t:CDS:2 [Acaulospora colombiana]|uniref:12264_t:CDS:1 n=1 Tax=Acaulospora colombiana TaxID=27376 RepID=A0ACA9KEP9_9GLOM|nr:12264_t:CDS:2 [Acaulospora colombiana]